MSPKVSFILSIKESLEDVYTKNLITLCFATVFTLGLAACGGGGGGGGGGAPVTGMPDTIEPIELEAHACDADAGPSQACVDARQAELEAIENDSDATVGALNAAEMALATAQTALADADTAAAEEMTVSGLVDDAMTAIADITDESTPAAVKVGRDAIKAAQVSLDGMENLSADATAALQGRIDTLESSFSPNEMAVRMAAATAAAATKVTAIGIEGKQPLVDGTDAGLGGSVEADMDSTYSMTISRPRSGTEIKIANSANAGEDDPKFAQAMDLGHGRTMHVRTMEADDDGDVVTEVVIVSTDIAEPKATKFATVHDLLVNPKTAEGNDFQSIAVSADNLAMIATTGITAVGAGEITVKAAVLDDATTADMDETVAAFETDATFDGAPGTLKCAGTADCTVTLDADGEITEIGDDWEFTPADGATVDVDDTDYLHYGFWLKRTTDADGATTYNEVETFAGSSIAVSGSVASVTGSATYEGGATGVYVRETYKSTDGSVDTATSGHFRADASLTATFGQTVDDTETTTVDEAGTIVPNLVNTLAGTIDNFQLSGGDENEWSVNLQGGIETDDGMATGTANGGGDPGTFSATFHGPTEDADDVSIQPHTVVGEFNANFGNGTAAGSFGARKQ